MRAAAFFGLTYNLRVFPENEIHKGALQMAQKQLDERREKLDWGPEVSCLAPYTMEQVAERRGDGWMVIGGVVLDVNINRFVDDHPGGRRILELFAGKDATKAFLGAVYAHSNAARNLTTTLRVGRIALPPRAGGHSRSSSASSFRSAAASPVPASPAAHPEPLEDEQYVIVCPAGGR